jgi:hypothetical protein
MKKSPIYTCVICKSRVYDVGWGSRGECDICNKTVTVKKIMVTKIPKKQT